MRATLDTALWHPRHWRFHLQFCFQYDVPTQETIGIRVSEEEEERTGCGKTRYERMETISEPAGYGCL